MSGFLAKNTTLLDSAGASADIIGKRLVEAHFFNKPVTTLFKQ